ELTKFLKPTAQVNVLLIFYKHLIQAPNTCLSSQLCPPAIIMNAFFKGNRNFSDKYRNIISKSTLISPGPLLSTS
ncbi:hypothetical protein INR49_032534, partial [Caranx melampygus]